MDVKFATERLRGVFDRLRYTRDESKKAFEALTQEFAWQRQHVQNMRGSRADLDAYIGLLNEMEQEVKKNAT